MTSRGILQLEMGGKGGLGAGLHTRAPRITIDSCNTNDGDKNEQPDQGLGTVTIRRQLFDDRTGISAGQRHWPSPARQFGAGGATRSPRITVSLPPDLSARPVTRCSADRIRRRTRRNRAKTPVVRRTLIGSPSVSRLIRPSCTRSASSGSEVLTSTPATSGIRSGVNSLTTRCGDPAAKSTTNRFTPGSPDSGSTAVTSHAPTNVISSGVGFGADMRSGSLILRGILCGGGGRKSGQFLECQGVTFSLRSLYNLGVAPSWDTPCGPTSDSRIGHTKSGGDGDHVWPDLK